MDARQFGPDESSARNKQNILIAESCQHLKDVGALKPYKNYHDAGMKLLGYHVRNSSQTAQAPSTRVSFTAMHNLTHQHARHGLTYTPPTELHEQSLIGRCTLSWCHISTIMNA